MPPRERDLPHYDLNSEHALYLRRHHKRWRYCVDQYSLFSVGLREAFGEVDECSFGGVVVGHEGTRLNTRLGGHVEYAAPPLLTYVRQCSTGSAAP